MSKFKTDSKSTISNVSKDGRFWIYGLHAVQAALQNPKRRCYHLFYISDETLNSLKGETLNPSFQISKVDRSKFQHLFAPDAVHQGVALQISLLTMENLEDLISDQSPQVIIATLDQVTDPHNLGAIARSAASFGLRALLLPERHTPLLTSPVLYKTASGALEHISLIQTTNLARALQQLQQALYWNIGFDEEGTQSLDQSDLKGRINLILGAEGKGLRRLTQEHCDHLVHLPTSSSFGTLNVSNAAAIAFYEAHRQQRFLKK